QLVVESQRVAALRMQQEAAASLRIRGTSAAPRLTAGHKFQLSDHPNADGSYILTAVQHQFDLSDQEKRGVDYQNSFFCIALGLPFGPERLTPKPIIHGTQTAVVTGPAGEEIFSDKYGRVKVQFHWDREGKNDANSSCWIRVGALNAGKDRPLNFVPEIGDE